MFAREVEIGGGIGGDEVLTAEPGEESSHAAEACDLGVDDEGLISAWGPVVEEVVLIFCEMGAGEGFDGEWSVMMRPFAELPQRPAMGIGGCRGVGAGGETLEKGLDVGIEALVVVDGWCFGAALMRWG